MNAFDDDFVEICPYCGATETMATWRLHGYCCIKCGKLSLPLRDDDEQNPYYTIAYDDPDLLSEVAGEEEDCDDASEMP